MPLETSANPHPRSGVKFFEVLFVLAIIVLFAAPARSDCSWSKEAVDLPGEIRVATVEGSFAEGMRLTFTFLNTSENPYCFAPRDNGYALMSSVQLRRTDGATTSLCFPGGAENELYYGLNLPQARSSVRQTTAEPTHAITRVEPGEIMMLETYIAAETFNKLRRRSCDFFDIDASPGFLVEGGFDAVECGSRTVQTIEEWRAIATSQEERSFWFSDCIGR